METDHLILRENVLRTVTVPEQEANLKYLEGLAEAQAASAGASATAAGAAKTAAEAARDAASDSKVNAAQSKSDAASSATQAVAAKQIAVDIANQVTDLGTGVATAVTKAAEASASASAASASATAVSALLASFRGAFLGAFGDDAAATSFAAANGITLNEGVMYENTTSDKFRVRVDSGWANYDASAQASQSAAALSAGNAAASEANSAASATAAAGSATGAAATKAAIDSRYYGNSASDPVTRPDGSGMQAGDRYFSTISNYEKVYTGAAWQIPNVGAADLANVTDPAKGAALVGFLQEGLDVVPSTVDAKLKRLYRSPEEYGAVGDGIADDTAALVKMFSRTLYVALTPGKTYRVTAANQILMRDGHVIAGGGASIYVPSSATLADATGDGSFRYYNGIFAKTDNVTLTKGITVFGVKVVSDCVNMGFLLFNSKTYSSGSGQRGRLWVSQNDVILKSSGCGIIANDYELKAWKNEIRDSHYGIFAPGTYDGDIDNNRLEFSGVTRDFATWTNTAAISCFSPKRTKIHDNVIYVTGGSALFASATVGDAQDVEIYRNRITGAGLNGIATGVRTGSASTDTRHFDIWGNNVIGFLCAPGANLHSGISFDNEITGVTIRDILMRDNYVEYCAPWESFDTTNNQVTGSYNSLKSAGQTVGACYGCSIGSSTAVKINTARMLNNVVDHFQASAFLLNNIAYAEFSGKAYRTGWERNGSNAPVQALHPLFIQAVDHAVIHEITAKEPFRGVTADNTNAIPIRIRQCTKTDLLRAVIQTMGNVNYPIRTDGPPSVALTLGTVLSDALSVGQTFDAGNKALVTTGGGRITVTKAGPYLTSLVTGSRTISHGVDTLFKTATAALTTTLLNAADCPGLVLTFHCISNAGNAWTINAASGETVKGAASLTINQGESYVLISDGASAWYGHRIA